MKILLVQTSFLGDVVLSTPATEILHNLHPGCELWWMTTPLAAPIISADPLVEGVITFDKRGSNSGIFGAIRQAGQLRAHKFDCVYSLHRSARTAFVLALAGIPKRIGFKEARASFLYHEARKRDVEAPHEVQRNLSLFGTSRELSALAELRVVATEDEAFNSLLASNNLVDSKYVALAPGSSWHTKMWNPAHFREIGLRLEESGLKVVVIGAPNEFEISERVCAGTKFINLVNRVQIKEMVGIVKNASLVVCNDSFPLHLGSAFKVPTLAVFCSTVPEFGFGPWRNKSVVLGATGLSCRPCGRHGHKVCPTGTELCMSAVTAEQGMNEYNKII
jgi:heptosyltransferase-2